METPPLEDRPTSPVQNPLLDTPPTLGQRAAESVAAMVGSWWFIGLQSLGILSWVFLNATAIWLKPWDPYPFILMNLVLSLQAAYTAPMILMAQNRQTEKDRKILYGDFELDRLTHEAIVRIENRLRDNSDQKTQVP